ncbi:MAG: type II secretion system minor pseudopilin GspJ [Magnetococcales bacterium]|nr:type II secretion system minor pseudopilin GspJ [Magnetococcales bacterium]
MIPEGVRFGSGQRGFTLLELLAALAVFAVMSAMAYGGLNTLLQARDQEARHREALAGLRTFFYHFSRDVEQTVARDGVDGSRGRLAALSGRDGETRFLELTRGGRPNPRALVRSALERVGYALEEGRVVRRSWPVVDRVSEELPVGEVLLEEVSGVEIHFLGGDGQWRNDWPPSLPPVVQAKGTQQAGPVVPPLPRAVEIVVRKNGWGRIRRLFELAGGV